MRLKAIILLSISGKSVKKNSAAAGKNFGKFRGCENCARGPGRGRRTEFVGRFKNGRKNGTFFINFLERLDMLLLYFRPFSIVNWLKLFVFRTVLSTVFGLCKPAAGCCRLPRRTGRTIPSTSSKCRCCPCCCRSFGTSRCTASRSPAGRSVSRLPPSSGAATCRFRRPLKDMKIP